MEKEREINYQIAIIMSIILIILLFMVIVGTTFSFFSKQEIAQGNIALGELDFDVSLSYPNELVMPGDTVDVDAKVINAVQQKTNLIPFYFRFKLSNSNEIDISVNSENYVLGNDGFYYCKKKVLKNKSEVLFNAIKISERITDLDELNFGILIDAVQSEYGAYRDVFENAPAEWVEFIENN